MLSENYFIALTWSENENKVKLNFQWLTTGVIVENQEQEWNKLDVNHLKIEGVSWLQNVYVTCLNNTLYDFSEGNSEDKSIRVWDMSKR